MARTDRERYTEVIAVRYTASAWKRIKTHAKKANLSPSIFARQVVLNHLDMLEKKQ